MNTLYIVPTPIGNLGDMTIRSIKILKEVKLIAAEDTRHSRILLNHFDIKTRMTSFHEHNKQQKTPYILNVLRDGDVALITDAGTPTISDPGFELVNEVIANQYKIVPLPGPSAITVALSASGLMTKSFTFLGFLQRNHKTKLLNLLSQFKMREEAIVLFENPKRLVNTLSLLLDVLGNRSAVVALEMTKMFEEFQRGSLEQLITYFGANPPRGEVTIILQGKIQEEDENIWSERQVRDALSKALSEGAKRSIAAKQISKVSGWSRQSIYSLLEE